MEKIGSRPGWAPRVSDVVERDAETAVSMDDPAAYLPRKVNSGNWFTAYTFNELEKRIASERVVLPICSLGTPVEELAALAPLVLPPLYVGKPHLPQPTLRPS